MGKLSDKLNTDLKQAMLSGDKMLVSTIKSLKSAIQYAQVAPGSGRELSEEDIQNVLKKESKKRADAIRFYEQAKDSARAEGEKSEKKIIDSYLPEPLSREQIAKMVDDVMAGQEDQNMGKIIGEVKKISNGQAEGSLIAEIVKERLSR